MHANVGEVLYSIFAILRILQSLTVPSALVGIHNQWVSLVKILLGTSKMQVGGCDEYTIEQ